MADNRDVLRRKPQPKKRERTVLADLGDALNSYWKRQGRHAQGGLDMAEQGANEFRDTLSPVGLGKMFAGPVSYLASPVSALVPDDQDINSSRDLPEWAKPGARALSQTALLALPGPDLGPVASSAGNAARRFGDDFATTFGVEVPEGAAVYGAGPVIRKPQGIMSNKPGIGRGLGDLLGDGTQAEQAALRRRLETEADQKSLDAIDAADPGKDISPETVKGWFKSRAMDMESIMKNELAQAVAAGDTAKAEKLRKELRGMGYAVENPAAAPQIGPARLDGSS